MHDPTARGEFSNIRAKAVRRARRLADRAASRDSGLIIWHRYDERTAYDYVSTQALRNALCISSDDPRLKGKVE